MFGTNNPTSQDNFAIERENYQSQLANGANWFYWIAGLTLITTLVQVFGGNFSFAIGLGITQVVEGVAQVISAEMGGGMGIVRTIGIIIQVAFIAIFALFGFLANKGWTWVFIVGMAIYALDGLIFVLDGSIIGIIIHVLALYYLFMGLSAAWNLNKLGRS